MNTNTGATIDKEIYRKFKACSVLAQESLEESMIKAFKLFENNAEFAEIVEKRHIIVQVPTENWGLFLGIAKGKKFSRDYALNSAMKAFVDQFLKKNEIAGVN